MTITGGVQVTCAACGFPLIFTSNGWAHPGLVTPNHDVQPVITGAAAAPPPLPIEDPGNRAGVSAPTCKHCQAPIAFDGACWHHLGVAQPRHMAWPADDWKPPLSPLPIEDPGNRAGVFLLDVAVELSRAQAKWPPMHSLHEAYAVILEELDELWDHVKQKQNERDPEAIRKELTQLCAMVARAAVDLEGKGYRV